MDSTSDDRTANNALSKREPPTTVHGAPIYTDPPRIKMRPRGVCGVAWWEECADDDPDGVEYVPATALAASEARVAEMREALREAEEVFALVEHPAIPDPLYHEEVVRLGCRIGFGALMTTASAGWREVNEVDGYPGSGAFVAGPCIGTVQATVKRIRAALAPDAE